MAQIDDDLFDSFFLNHGAVLLLIEPESGQIVDGNRAAERFYGYSRADLRAKRIQELNLLDSDDVARQRQLADRGEQSHFVFPHRLADGSQRMVEVDSTPIVRGGCRLLVSVIHDVSERFRIEHSLQQSEERFRLLFDGAPDASILADAETGVIVDVNRAAEQLLQKPRLLLVGSHFSSLHPPELEESTRQKFRQHMTAAVGQMPQAIEHWVLRADGARVPVEVTASLLGVGERRLQLGVFRDVSQRREMERALRESEERWTFAIEGSEVGVWDWDVVSGRVHFTPRWKAMLGFDDDDVGNDLSAWKELVHPDDLEGVLSVLEAHLRGETTHYESEHRLRCKDGSYKWILDRGMVVRRNADGSPSRAVGTHKDISARKVVELETQQLVEELQEALGKVKQLRGLLPICAACKSVRGDQGYWERIESYIAEHSEAEFTHSICPDCEAKLYPELAEDPGGR